MFTLKLVLVVAALIFFLIAAVGVPTGRFGLIGAGLFAWLLSEHVG